MHMTLNWCFKRVLINAIGFNRCFIILSFKLATLQQFFKKRQNRRYYHFKGARYFNLIFFNFCDENKCHADECNDFSAPLIVVIAYRNFVFQCTIDEYPDTNIILGLIKFKYFIFSMSWKYISNRFPSKIF